MTIVKTRDATCKIGLAKGEQGEGIERFLRGYSFQVNLTKRPLDFCQKFGDIEFIPLPSTDVTREVAKGNLSFGVTGLDLVLATSITFSTPKVQIIEQIDIAPVDLVLFSKDGKLDPKTKNPTIVVPWYYCSFLTRANPVLVYVNDTWGNPKIKKTNGSTECYVKNNWAEMGFDATTWFTKKTDEERGKTTLAKNGLAPLKRFLRSDSVVITKCGDVADWQKFERVLRCAGKLSSSPIYGDR
jgi:ATP phosphoribosyltransferase